MVKVTYKRQLTALLVIAFEYGTWGGEFRGEFEPQPGEIVALRPV